VGRFAGFLRAINVGGRRVTNDVLRRELEAIGLTDVATIQAAGTVVFTSNRRSTDALGAEIGAALEAALGHEVTTFVRSKAEVDAIVAADPFGAGSGGAKGGGGSVGGNGDSKVHIVFLPKAPTAAVRAKVEALGVPGDELKVVAKELHWHRAGPMMESALDWKQVEQALGKVPTTTRTRATVEKTAQRLAE
jgi:uncharacterized protein (DUF1697 family)